MEKIIALSKANIDFEHICCAISDRKCKVGYDLKKDWLRREFENGYVMQRIDARAKVFIEYGPADKGFCPLKADNYLLINCFWVSGKYKNRGYAKALLQKAIDDAIEQGKNGLVTVVGTNKFHFMSDAKWLLSHGFISCDSLVSGFSLLVLQINKNASMPFFNDNLRDASCNEKQGLVVYYSNRCPFTEFHVSESLVESAKKRNIPLKIIKLETYEQAQNAPTPATIFSLFYNGKFVTTDLSSCLDSRLDKHLK